jgi:hypothetical protein
VPTLTPVTLPEGVTVTIDEPLVNIPLEVASDNVIVALTHTLSGPVIGTGNGVTVTEVVTKQPPGRV